MAMSRDDSFIKTLDDYFRTLLSDSVVTISDPDENQSASANAQPTIGFLDRLKLFEAGARWVGIKNRLDVGDNEDEFAKLRRGHVGGKRVSRSTGA